MASQFYPTNNRQPNETYPSGPPPPYAYVPVDPFKPSLAFSLNNILPTRPGRGNRHDGQTQPVGSVEGGTLDWAGRPFYSLGNARPLDQGLPHPPASRRQDPGRYAPRPTAIRYPQELHDYNDYVPTSYHRPTTGWVDGNYASPALPTRGGQPGVVPPQRRPSMVEQATRSSSIIHGVPMSAVPADGNPRPNEQSPAEPPLTRPLDTASYAVPQPTIIQELSQQIPDNASQDTSQALPQLPRPTSSNGPFPRFAFASPPVVIPPPSVILPSAVIPPPAPSSHQNGTITQHEVLQNFFASLLNARSPSEPQHHDQGRNSSRRDYRMAPRVSSSQHPIQRSPSRSPSINSRRRRSRSRGRSRNRRSNRTSLENGPHSIASSSRSPASISTLSKHAERPAQSDSGPILASHLNISMLPQSGRLSTEPPTAQDNSTPVPSTQAYILAFLLDTIPRQIYLYLLLRLPYLYFSRVTRIFEEAEMSMPMIRLGILDAARAKAEVGYETGMGMNNWAGNGRNGRAMSHPDLPWAFEFEPPADSAAYANLQKTWQAFIDSLLKEWKTLNIISVLLLSAILTILQLDGAAADPVTRYSALLSMICALMSLLYGCIFIIRFGTMRKTYKGAEWAEEAQKSRTGIWWNIWVLLAMPATWLAWSMILYITTVMAFVWRTSPFPSPTLSSTTIPSKTSPQILVPRIVISLVLTLGLVYFILIALTLRKYGEMMDRAWQRRIWGWMRDGVGAAGAQSRAEKGIPQKGSGVEGEKYRPSFPTPPSHPHGNGRGPGPVKPIRVRGPGKEEGITGFTAGNPDKLPDSYVPHSTDTKICLPPPFKIVDSDIERQGSYATTSSHPLVSAPIQSSFHTQFIALQGTSHQPSSELGPIPAVATHVQSRMRTPAEEHTQRSLTRRQEENYDGQRNPSATFVPALVNTVAPEKEKLNGLLKALTMPFMSRAKNTTNAEVRDDRKAEKTLIDPGPSKTVSSRSSETTGTTTPNEIKMVKLFDLLSAGPCSDALMERDLTEYGLTWDALGGEDGKKQWELFKKQIRAAVSLSSPHSYFTSTSKSEHNSIILIFDKFNAYLQLCEIKGQVALCEEFGRHWAGFAIYYFANSGTWPEPYEEFQCLGDKRNVTRENESMKTKRIQRYQSIPDGLQRLDVSVFVPVTKSTASTSGPNHVGEEVESACNKKAITLANQATSQTLPLGMVETRKISLFSEHPANASK